ncbi:MAG: DUF4912 domain-containing protein [Campylobacterales bacterium]
MSEENNPLLQGAGPTPSSDMRADATLATEAAAPRTGNDQIPETYGQNRLVLLPVNAHTQHFYWEIGDEALLDALSRSRLKLEIRLYYVTQDQRREIETVGVGSARGNYYTYHTPNLQQMEAVLYGTDETGATQVLLTSNRITGPSSGMHSSPWEIWMTKKGKEHKLESKPAGDMPAPEALTSPSSLDLVLRAEQLRARLGDMGAGNPSSDFASRHLFSSDETAKGSQ